MSEEDFHWNRRTPERPWGLFLLVVVLCAVLAWLLARSL